MTMPEDKIPEWDELARRLDRAAHDRLILRVNDLEAYVRRLDALMAPLKIMPDAELGEPQTALDFLSYLVGILKGRVDTLTERVDAQELRWKEFTSL